MRTPSSTRRLLVQALACGSAWPVVARSATTAAAALRSGGVAVVMRLALAPGTFDPPGFRLGDCGTQRNLSDDGRAQAKRIGAWFAARGMVPAVVRSSPWCRCIDTAQMAFGRATPWAALGSVINARDQSEPQTAELRAALAVIRPGQFEVWVTHQVNISALTGEYAESGAAVVVRHTADGGAPALMATLSIA